MSGQSYAVRKRICQTLCRQSGATSSGPHQPPQLRRRAHGPLPIHRAMSKRDGRRHQGERNSLDFQKSTQGNGPKLCPDPDAKSLRDRNCARERSTMMSFPGSWPSLDLFGGIREAILLRRYAPPLRRNTLRSRSTGRPHLGRRLLRPVRRLRTRRPAIGRLASPSLANTAGIRRAGRHSLRRFQRPRTARRLLLRRPRTLVLCCTGRPMRRTRPGTGPLRPRRDAGATILRLLRRNAKRLDSLRRATHRRYATTGGPGARNRCGSSSTRPTGPPRRAKLRVLPADRKRTLRPTARGAAQSNCQAARTGACRRSLPRGGRRTCRLAAGDSRSVRRGRTLSLPQPATGDPRLMAGMNRPPLFN